MAHTSPKDGSMLTMALIRLQSKAGFARRPNKEMNLEVVLCDSSVLVTFMVAASYFSESLDEFYLRLALLCQIMIPLSLFEIYMEGSIKLF